MASFSSNDSELNSLRQKYGMNSIIINLPLFLARQIADKGTVDELMVLLRTIDSFELLFHIAVICVHANRLDLVRVILDFGLPVEFEDSRHNTLMYYAAESGVDNIIRFLISRGGQVSVSLVPPIIAATRELHPSTVKLLLAAGADPTIRFGYDNQTIYHIDAQTSQYNNMQLGPGWVHSKIEILQLLVTSNIPGLESIDGRGETPLHSVISSDYYFPVETLEFIRVLLKLIFNSPTQGSSLNTISYSRDTPTDMAVSNLVSAAIDELFKFGSSANISFKWIEIISTLRAVGGSLNYYLIPETNEIAVDKITQTLETSVIDENGNIFPGTETRLYQLRDQIVEYLQTPLTEEEIYNLRYPIFFRGSQLDQLLQWA